MPSFPAAKTITIHRETVTGQGAYGADQATVTPILVPGCAVWPRTSAETVQGQDLVTTGITVFAPPGTVVEPTDTVTVDGITYDQVGDAAIYDSPLTGTLSGVELQLVKVTG